LLNSKEPVLVDKGWHPQCVLWLIGYRHGPGFSRSLRCGWI